MHVLESQHSVSVLANLIAAVTAVTNRNLWSLAHKDVATKYRRLAYWTTAVVALSCGSEELHVFFVKSACHAGHPLPSTQPQRGKDGYSAALLWYFHAQSLTAPQTAGCSPTEGSLFKTVPGVQRGAAPASARIDMYNSKAYFSALSWTKDPA